MSTTESIKHKIYTRHMGGAVPNRVYRSLIKQAALVTLKSESVDLPCVISVLITDDDGIRKYNREHRNKDKTTDVLSFPMQSFARAGWFGISDVDIDYDTETVPLGDIIISTSTIKRNARRHRSSVEEETVRMIIHSTMHLLGYDHSDVMRYKEAALMKYMGYLT